MYAQAANEERKYLRVRGEEFLPTGIKFHIRNTSACAEKSVNAIVFTSMLGNTSACAEKSRELWHIGGRQRKYLRVRGEEKYRHGCA